MRLLIFILFVLIPFSLDAREESEAEANIYSVVISSSLEALFSINVIQNIDQGNLVEARSALCSNLDVHLMVLSAFVSDYPMLDNSTTEKTLKYIAKNAPECDLSAESRAVLNKYLLSAE